MVMVFSWLGKKNKNDFTEKILSPKEKLVCEVSCQDGKVYYQVLETSHRVVTTRSQVGLTLYREKAITDNLRLIKKYARSMDDAREVVFYFINTTNKKLITLRFRVFDDGVAFRYEIPAQPKMQRAIISEERCEFGIRQGDFVVREAALYNYGAMNKKNEITKLRSGNIACVELPFETPWRVICAKNSNLVEKLNREPRRDFGWVKPIKALALWWPMVIGKWSWTDGTTLERADAYMESCKKYGFGGLMIDGVHTDIAERANAKKISLICNLDFKCGKREMENILRSLAINNIHYARFGYVPAKYKTSEIEESWASQAGVKYLQDIIELAARYHIMLEMPSVWKNTGTNKTWPNILARKCKYTQDIKSLMPSEMCNLACSESMNDCLNGIFDLNNKNKPIHSTLAAQLAYYVVFSSGIQMAIDRPEVYERYLDVFDFIQNVPVEWNKTVPLFAKYGECYAVAKKCGTSWYVGGINNEEAKNVQIDFVFLGAGKYRAKIYRDGDKADYQRNKMDVEIFDTIINKDRVMNMWMAAGGGFVMEIKKVS